MVKLEIIIDDKEIGKFLKKPAQAITCKGASGESEPVTALVEVIGAPRNAYDSGESYVLCPRLKKLYGYELELRCYEGKLADHDENDKKQFEDSKVCPYFRPAKERR